MALLGAFLGVDLIFHPGGLNVVDLNLVPARFRAIFVKDVAEFSRMVLVHFCHGLHDILVITSASAELNFHLVRSVWGANRQCFRLTLLCEHSAHILKIGIY